MLGGDMYFLKAVSIPLMRIINDLYKLKKIVNKLVKLLLRNRGKTQFFVSIMEIAPTHDLDYDHT